MSEATPQKDITQVLEKQTNMLVAAIDGFIDTQHGLSNYAEPFNWRNRTGYNKNPKNPEVEIKVDDQKYKIEYRYQDNEETPTILVSYPDGATLKISTQPKPQPDPRSGNRRQRKIGFRAESITRITNPDGQEQDKAILVRDQGGIRLYHNNQNDLERLKSIFDQASKQVNPVTHRTRRS